jgi:opacity protein-like surface antigen
MSLKHWMAVGASAATLLTSNAASAQDTYLKLFGGWTIPQDEDFELNDQDTSRSSGFDFDSGYAVGAALGFAYSPNIAIEMEYVYRNADAKLKGTRNTNSGTLDSNAVMVNAIYAFPPFGATSMFHPYVGAGLGVGDFSYDRDDLELDSDYNLAYQIIAGISYDVSYQASLYTEARYFGINEQTIENDDYSFKAGYGTIDVLFGYSYKF